jgi:leucyl/phenylalanyl-tRNA---protein transferase
MRNYSAETRADPAFPWLSDDEWYPFPDPGEWRRDGLVCVGGNLSPGMLLSAYAQGVFPWFGERDPLLWQSPDPRFVLFPEKLHISESLRRMIRKAPFELSLDRDFPSVIRACSLQARPGQRGTWITADMVEAYIRLHGLGFAHSVEAWSGGRLAGGLYGVSLGRVFFGESMFHAVDGASKIAFAAIALRLREEGFSLIDSQARTAHMASFGAEDVPRSRYVKLLRDGVAEAPHARGDWAALFPGFPDSPPWRKIAEGGSPC